MVWFHRNPDANIVKKITCRESWLKWAMVCIFPWISHFFHLFILSMLRTQVILGRCIVDKGGLMVMNSLSSMEEVANIALLGQHALMEKNYTEFAQLLNHNFDLRRCLTARVASLSVDHFSTTTSEYCRCGWRCPWMQTVPFEFLLYLGWILFEKVDWARNALAYATHKFFQENVYSRLWGCGKRRSTSQMERGTMKKQDLFKGVDYSKYDNCFNPGIGPKDRRVDDTALWAFNIGFVSDDVGLDAENCKVLVNINQQSPDICQGVHDHLTKYLKEIGAGNQGHMFGDATDETPEFMPLATF